MTHATVASTLPTHLTDKYHEYASDIFDWVPAYEHSAIRYEHVADLEKSYSPHVALFMLLQILKAELLDNDYNELLADLKADYLSLDNLDFQIVLGYAQSFGYITLDTALATTPTA